MLISSRSWEGNGPLDRVHSWLGGDSCGISQRFMERSSFYNLGVGGFVCEPPAVKQEEAHFQQLLTLRQTPN